MKKTHYLCYLKSRHHYAWDCLRTPFTTLPTVLSDIAGWFWGLMWSSLGLLTSLPLLTFAIFSPFAIQFAQKLGIEAPLLLCLIANDDRICHSVINLPSSFGNHLD